jgi:ribosomal protein S18 acetylase RimI-like enzyme
VFLAARRQAMSYLPKLHSDADVRDWIEHVMMADCAVMVAELDGRLAGFGACANGFLHHLYVAPETQGQGVGGRLLAAAQAAHPDGLRLYAFQRNTKARAFYEKRGFKLLSMTDGQANEEREPDALYEWRSAT